MVLRHDTNKAQTFPFPPGEKPHLPSHMLDSKTTSDEPQHARRRLSNYNRVSSFLFGTVCCRALHMRMKQTKELAVLQHSWSHDTHMVQTTLALAHDASPSGLCARKPAAAWTHGTSVCAHFRHRTVQFLAAVCGQLAYSSSGFLSK